MVRLIFFPSSHLPERADHQRDLCQAGQDLTSQSGGHVGRADGPTCLGRREHQVEGIAEVVGETEAQSLPKVTLVSR